MEDLIVTLLAKSGSKTTIPGMYLVCLEDILSIIHTCIKRNNSGYFDLPKEVDPSAIEGSFEKKSLTNRRKLL